MTLKRILVPLDGSALAERALTYATAVARPTGAELLLLRVTNSHTLPGVDPRERQLGAIEDAQQYIDGEVARVSALGVACQGVVRFGKVADCISESARTRQVDLIVMTTHGRTGPGRWIVGSVTETVVAWSQVPVLVQLGWQPLFGNALLEHPKVVLALDGSTFAEAALDPAATFASDLGAQLILVSVEDDPTSLRDAADYLAVVQASLAQRHPELSVTCEVRNGEAARGIESVVVEHEASLVFMATHGRTGPRRAVFGSVAGKLLQECDVPVVLLRPAPVVAEELVSR